MAFGSSEKTAGLFNKLKKAKQSVASTLHDPQPASDSSAASSSRPWPVQNVSVASVTEHPSPDLPDVVSDAIAHPLMAPEPEIVARPFIKIKVITWNMAESLPTGDLTELLGDVPRPEACNNLPRSPLHPDLPELPLNDDHLYHIIVVGAQESPWLPSTIHDIRAGGKRNKQPHSKTTWTDVLTDWFCRGAGHKYQEQHASNSAEDPPYSPAPPTIKRSSTSKTTDDLQAEKGEHPVQKLPIQTPLEQTLLDEKHDPLEDLPDSPIKSKEKPPAPASIQRTASMRSSSSSSCSSNEASEDLEQRRRDRTPSDASSMNASEETSVPEQTEEEEAGPYVFVAKERMLGIYVSVFVLKSAHHLLQGVGKGKVTAGLLGGRMGNKGAAALSVHFAGLRFLFVSAHLAAHQNNLAARRQNIDKIKTEMVIDDFTQKIEDQHLKDELDNMPDITDRFDSCFWFGDLNFRLNISRLHADFLLKSKNWEHMLSFDQLNALMKERNNCLRGFREAPIKFAPTYKYDLIPRKKLHRRSTQTASDRSSFKGRPQSVSSLNAVQGSSTAAAAGEVSPSLPSETDNSDAASIISTTTAGFDSSGEMRPDTPSALSSPPELDENALIPAAVQKARMKILGIIRSKSTNGQFSFAQAMAADDSASVHSQQPPKSPRPELLRSTQSDHPNRGTIAEDEEHEEAVDQVAVFDTSRKQRVQSYTDRILYKSAVSKTRDADKSIARKLGTGIVDGLRSATRTLNPAPTCSTPTRPSSINGPGSPQTSRQVSFDVNGSPSHSPRLLSATSTTTAVPWLHRNSSVRSQASSHHSSGSRGPLNKILHPRRHHKSSTIRSQSMSLPDANKSDGDLLESRIPQSKSAALPDTSGYTDSPAASNTDLTPIASSSSTPVGHDMYRSTTTGQVHFPRKMRREPPMRLSLSKTETLSQNSPSRHRASRPSSTAFSLRHWWNQHLPLWTHISGSSDSLDLSRIPTDSPMATPDAEPPVVLIGPNPGQIHCLAYDTANDLRRMEAYSDHRPLFGVYAVGLEPVT